MQTMDARFKVVPAIINQSCTSTTIASATATAITGTKAYLHPREAGEGMAFKFMVAGSKTGTNAAQTVALYINGSAVCTCTADSTAAVDWECEITIFFKSVATQKIKGKLLMDTDDPDIQYDAGTADCSGGATLELRATSHASDSLVCEMASVEKWQFAPMATA